MLTSRDYTKICSSILALFLLGSLGCSNAVAPPEGRTVSEPSAESDAAKKASFLQKDMGDELDPASNAVLALVNEASFQTLDDDVELDRRAAEHIVEHRNGPDGVLGTGDDNLFDDLQELDDIYFVGPSAFEKLRDYAQNYQVNSSSGTDEDGTQASENNSEREPVHGIDPGSPDATRILAVANGADLETLDASVALDVRAAESIVAHRAGDDGQLDTSDDIVIEDLSTLAALYYVGDRAFQKLLTYARNNGYGPGGTSDSSETQSSPSSAGDGIELLEVIKVRGSKENPEKLELEGRVAKDLIRLLNESGRPLDSGVVTCDDSANRCTITAVQEIITAGPGNVQFGVAEASELADKPNGVNVLRDAVNHSDSETRFSCRDTTVTNGTGVYSSNVDYEVCKIDVDTTSFDTDDELAIGFDNLANPGDNLVYEGWLVVDGSPVSTGRFNSFGTTVVTLRVDRQIKQKAPPFVLTVEPETGDDPAPSKQHILAGPTDPDSYRAQKLHFDHPKATGLGPKRDRQNSTFILKTPTTASDSSDDNQGVWFLDPRNKTASLNLPVPNEGWKYEGWLVPVEQSAGSGADSETQLGEPVSLGSFRQVKGADSDGAGPAAGPDPAPAFPGQDFIDPARTFEDGLVVITLEPKPDPSATPFFLKVAGRKVRTVGKPRYHLSLPNARNSLAEPPAGELKY